eukprot:CAMPEP_0174941718 /NCGR_PEP_ID=MMETSP1355-20121228/72499_1 /TAXON_ID=464990 /ORGANISM="Hemiselmis tepida, Strain CCMP443" /LENGTH=163 /DNA_ID=CAMNT_0016188843 /DNA_START=69 /DNA_END=557 /DNA_ORIENTATION=+
MPGGAHYLYSAEDAERASSYATECWSWALDYTGIHPKPKPVSGADQVLLAIRESLSPLEPYVRWSSDHLSFASYHAAEWLSLLNAKTSSFLTLAGERARAVHERAAALALEYPTLLWGGDSPGLILVCAAAAAVLLVLCLLLRRFPSAPPSSSHKASPAKLPT